MGESDGEKWADSVFSVCVCVCVCVFLHKPWSHSRSHCMFIFREVSKLAVGNYILSDPLTWDSVPGLGKIKADLNRRIDEECIMWYPW